MEYEVTVKMRLRSPFGAERVKSLVEASFEFGTVREAIAEGAKLGEDPNYVRVTVCRTQDDACHQVQHVTNR